MNLPKQSRPVMREVSGDPLKARVEASQIQCVICNALPFPANLACKAIFHCP